MDGPGVTGRKASLSDYLAAERTLLAWIRTGLALMGFGFVVARFGIFLQQLQVLHTASSREPFGLSLWFGTALIIAGIMVNVFAGWRHLRLVRELDRGETSQSHPWTQGVAIALFLALVGLAMALYLVSVS
jgi:putative membrane protein